MACTACEIACIIIFMSSSLIICVAAALIDPDNRVLIQQRPEGKDHAGFWEFPGGKVEANETPEQALVRELHEELNVTTIEKALFPMTFVSYPYPKGHMLMPLYGIRNWAGQIETRINQNIAWVRPQRLGDYNLLDSNRTLISTLITLI